MADKGKSDRLMLFEIKKLIEKGAVVSKYQSTNEKVTKIHQEIMDLNTKFEDLKDIVISVKKKGDSQRKLKMKKNEIMIEAAYGLGEVVVSGSVTPDTYVVDKDGFKIQKKDIAKQTWMLMKHKGENAKAEIKDEKQEAKNGSAEVTRHRSNGHNGNGHHHSHHASAGD